MESSIGNGGTSKVLRRRIVGGFTLIELLVVVGIIALLIAILLPALQRATAEARKISCASQMRQWGAAVNSYAGDWDGRYPQRYYASNYPNVVRGTSMMSLLGDYMGLTLIERGVGDDNPLEMLHCPTVDRYRDYGVNVSPSWAEDMEVTFLGYLYFPNVRYTHSSVTYYVDMLWHTRERMGGPAREAPILSDVWNHPEISDFNDRPEPGRPDYNAHSEISADEHRPAGLNGLTEDGSVRWTEADDVMPGQQREGHHTAHFRYNVPYSGLDIYPDGDAYEDRLR